MTYRIPAFRLLAFAALLALLPFTAAAQDDTAVDELPARPMYAHPRPNVRSDFFTAATPLKTWNGSFTYQSQTYKYNMVGTSPSTGTATTIPVFIIPVVLSYVTSKGTTTYSPLTKQTNGLTALQNTIASPIFASMDFKSGGIDLGTTQYIDAFQRGNFWSKVSLAPGYHLLLGTPTVLPTLTLKVPTADGKILREFGLIAGTVDINWFDTQIESYITAHTQIGPNSLPIFMTYNSYLTQSGCCIGGYHSSFGSTAAAQSYAHFTYISIPGLFAQDVSALSHEIGEWADDPLVVNFNGNPTACGALEVGDPEEGEPNYGGFQYTLGGFTYNLQDLVFLPYFGASTTKVVNHSLTFHGNTFGLTVCSNGG